MAVGHGDELDRHRGCFLAGQWRHRRQHDRRTISTSGVYAAPARLQAPATVTVKAVAVAESDQGGGVGRRWRSPRRPACRPDWPRRACERAASRSPGPSPTMAVDWASAAITSTAMAPKSRMSRAARATPTPASAASTTYSYQVADASTPPLVSARSAALAVTTLGRRYPGPDRADRAGSLQHRDRQHHADLERVHRSSQPRRHRRRRLFVYRNGTQIATVTTGTTFTDTRRSRPQRPTATGSRRSTMRRMCRSPVRLSR